LESSTQGGAPEKRVSNSFREALARAVDRSGSDTDEAREKRGKSRIDTPEPSIDKPARKTAASDRVELDTVHRSAEKRESELKRTVPREIDALPRRAREKRSMKQTGERRRDHEIDDVIAAAGRAEKMETHTAIAAGETVARASEGRDARDGVAATAAPDTRVSRTAVPRAEGADPEKGDAEKVVGNDAARSGTAVSHHVERPAKPGPDHRGDDREGPRRDVRGTRVGRAERGTQDEKLMERLERSDHTDRVERDQREPVVREIVVDLETERSEDAPRTDVLRAVPTALRQSVQNAQSSQNGVAQAHLVRRLNGDLGQTIVRQARVIMSEANRGEIRLVIRPPELGRVRIDLQMENGHIAGRILVDNGSVREVFEQNLASLQRAFAEAGLELGDLEVSTSGENARDAQERAGNGRSLRSGNDTGAHQFDDSVEPIVQYDYGKRRINLVA
jgi:hypothetical protein